MSRKIDVYTIKELKELNYSAYEKAHSKFAEQESYNIPWNQEITDSLEKTFLEAGVTLHDYSLGLDNSRVKFSIPTYWSELAERDILVDDYTGNAAKKWLKDAFGIHSIKLVHYISNGKKKKRYDFFNKDGLHWDGFTGICYDFDFVESLFMDVNDGENLHDAFSNLASVYERILNAELEYACSEENFEEMCSANDWKFLENGRMI